MPNPLKRSRQHWVVVGVALAVTLGAAAASALGLSANPSLKHTAAASPTPSVSGSAAASGSASAGASVGAAPSASAAAGLVAGAHPMKFGLDYGATLMSQTPTQIRTSLQDAAAVGAAWIRIDLPWESIQPTDSHTYDWGRFDVVAGTAKAAGLKIDAVLDATAYWDTTPACKKGMSDTEFCPPVPADFAKFAGAAVARYKTQGVAAWEIWNEPNIAARWWPTPNATAYAELLSVVTKAIHNADHNAFVLMGGLAAVPDSAAQGYVSQKAFLNAVVRVPGAMANVNAISYHPFSAPTPASRAGDFLDVSSSPGNLLSILQTSGNPKVQIWITESGSTVFDGASEPIGTPATAAQLQAQAAYATDLVKTVSTNPNVAADFWFADQDIPSQGLYWGLRDAHGATRPAFDALKSAIAACGCSTG